MKTEKSISSCVLLLSKEVNMKDQNGQFQLLPPLYPEDAYEPYMGIFLTIFSIPVGLLLGFLIANCGFNWLVEQGNLVST